MTMVAVSAAVAAMRNQLRLAPITKSDPIMAHADNTATDTITSGQNSKAAVGDKLSDPWFGLAGSGCDDGSEDQAGSNGNHQGQRQQHLSHGAIAVRTLRPGTSTLARRCRLDQCERRSRTPT